MFKLILTAMVLGGAKAKTLPAPTVTDTREATLACYWETYLYPKFSSSDIETNLSFTEMPNLTKQHGK